ncbi:MAG: DUF502 domain-containing protein [Gemmatimonadaceae bacterium]|nr:DUF502 domain-containing protein [Chitinophagaceae bacterium]
MSTRRFKWRWRKVLQYLLQGILVVAPVAITIYLIYWFVSSVDSWIPIFTEKDVTGRVVNQNYGLGFVVIFVALVVIGFLSSNFLTSRIFSLFDEWLERTPGIKFIYSSVKDLFEAFAGNKRKFKKAVLVSIGQPDIFQLGFITDEDASEFGLKDYVAVYVPQSYAFAGHLYMVPKTRVRVLNDVSASDALKYAISGGVAEVEEERIQPGSSTQNPGENPHVDL